MRWLWFLAGISLCASAQARMYQWTDPESGTAYLSGIPPAWYRSAQGGPRVLVFEDGKVVDDTEWSASRERERALREKAMEELQARKEAERQRKAELAQQAASKDQEAEEEDQTGLKGEEDAVAIFRALLSEFDKQKGKTKPAGQP